MSTCNTSKKLLLDFVHGSNSHLQFDQKSLKVTEQPTNDSLVETIRALCQLLSQTKIGEELRSDEKIAFSNRLRTLNDQTGHAFLRKIFYHTVKDYDILTALDENALEFILESLSKNRFDPYLYSNLNSKLIEWISKKEKLTSRETQFCIKVLPYIEDKKTYLRKVSNRLSLSVICCDPMDLIRLQRESSKFKSKKIEKAIVNRIITTEINFFSGVVDVLNELTHHLYSFDPLQYHSILSFLNDLFPTKLKLILSLLESESSKTFALIFLEIAFESDPGEEVDGLIRLLLNILKPTIFLEIINEHPHLQYLIRYKKHAIVRLLIDTPSLCNHDIEMAFKLEDCTPSGRIVELAFQKRQFIALEWMLRNGAPLHVRSIFVYNPPASFLRELIARKKIVYFNDHDLEMVLLYGSSELIDAARELFPTFNILLEQSNEAFNYYCSNPAANIKQFNQLFSKKIERLNHHFQTIAFSRNTKDENDRSLKFIFHAALKSTPFFLEIIESNPLLYRIVHKNALLRISLKNEHVTPAHILRLVQDGAEITPSLMYQILLIKNYRTGFLKELLAINPKFKQIILNEMESQNLGFSLTSDHFYYLKEEVFVDLYDVFVHENSTNLLLFIVKLINFFSKEELLSLLFSFLKSKQQDAHFKDFFFLPKNSKVHPFFLLKNFYIKQFTQEQLQFLSQVGTSKNIFGNDTLLKMFLSAERYDLVIGYVSLDHTLFNRKAGLITGAFLFSILRQLYAGVFQFTKREFFSHLGLKGVLECLRLGVRIHLEEDSPNPLFCFVKNRKDDSSLLQLSKEQLKPFSKFLEKKDHLGRSPLIAALSHGAYFHAICYMQMGAGVTPEDLFFDHLFKNEAKSKKVVFEYLFYHRIPCGHLLFDDRLVTAFEHGMRIGTEETVTWLLKLLALNLPSLEKLKKILFYVSAQRPKYLIPLMEAMPDGFFRTLLPTELLTFFKESLTNFDQIGRFDLKVQFVDYLLLLVDPNLKCENGSLLEIALNDKDQKLVLSFFKSNRFKPKYQIEVLKKSSIPQLLDLYEEIKHPVLLTILEERLEVQISFVKDLIQVGILSEKQMQPISDLVIRKKIKLGDDIQSLIPFYFLISSQLYTLPVLEAELPQKEDTSNFSGLLSLFYAYIPPYYTLPDDDGNILSRETLGDRLRSLLDHIAYEKNFSGIEADIPKFYAKMRNKICWILDWVKERDDPELTQQVVGFIARSGPGGHCGTRWVDEVDRFCNFLGPQVNPQNFMEWILIKLNDFRVGCFYQTAEKFPHKWGMNYEPHVRNLLRYYIQEDRGIHMKGGNYLDAFGGSFKKSQALKVFDSYHTAASLFSFTLDLINGPLKLHELEWIIATLKSHYQRFAIPDEIIDLRSRQKEIVDQIQREFKVVRTDPYIKQVHWMRLSVHYKNKTQFLEAVNRDCDEVCSLIRQENPTCQALRAEFATASYERKLQIPQLLRGSAFFETFIRDKSHIPFISHAIFSGQIEKLDTCFQAYFRNYQLKENIQKILRKYGLSVEDYTLLLKGVIDIPTFVNLAIVDRQKDIVVHSLYKRDTNNELLYFDLTGKQVFQETPGARAHFRELAAIILLDHLGAFQKK